MAESDQPDIIVEVVSPSERRFYYRHPVDSCELHNLELEIAENTMADDSLGDEIRESSHDTWHRLSEEGCPLMRAVMAIGVVEDEENLFIKVDHPAAGCVFVAVHLARLDFDYIAQQMSDFESAIIEVIAQMMQIDDVTTGYISFDRVVEQ